MSRLFHDLAVSTLKLADLKDSIRQSWQYYAADELSVTAGLTRFEEVVVARSVRPGNRVLVVGCGSGRDLVPLVERGCQVTGVDPAERALAIAQRVLRDRQLSATLVEAFFDDDAPLTGPFDAILFSSYSYACVPESSRRVAMLRKAAGLLAEGGHILLLYPPPHGLRRRSAFLARTLGAVSGSDWRFEPGDMFAPVERHAPRYGFQHDFERGEIDAEVAAARLRVVYRWEPPTECALVLTRGET